MDGRCAIVSGSHFASHFRSRWLTVTTDSFLAVGSGLMYMVRYDSHNAFVIGAQILVGLGVGPLLQTPIIATQATSDVRIIAKCTSIVSYLQRLGGALGVGV